MTTSGIEAPDGRTDQTNDPVTTTTLPGRLRAAVTGWLPQGPSATFAEKTSNQLAEGRTDLAVSRNLMAADRTLMAWIRTALSMNSFGFTIYKVLEAFQASGAGELPRAHSPRNIGLFLTGMGTFSMVLGAIAYWQNIKEVRQLKEVKLMRPTFVMGLLMAAMGVFLFFAIIAKLF